MNLMNRSNRSMTHSLATHKLRYINTLSPHDALKPHFKSLKTDLIFLQPRFLE